MKVQGCRAGRETNFLSTLHQPTGGRPGWPGCTYAIKCLTCETEGSYSIPEEKEAEGESRPGQGVAREPWRVRILCLHQGPRPPEGTQAEKQEVSTMSTLCPLPQQRGGRVHYVSGVHNHRPLNKENQKGYHDWKPEHLGKFITKVPSRAGF